MHCASLLNSRHRLIAFIVATSNLLATPLSARADVAPPEQPPGNTIAPTADTAVVMSSERVVIDVQLRPGAGNAQRGLVDSASLGRVTAVFTMTNPGPVNETMMTRFPLGGANDGFYDYPLVQGFAVSVNGKPVSHTLSASKLETESQLMWAHFHTTYPPGARTVISVSYVLSPTGYFPVASYGYVFSTGAAWSGPIGSAELIVRLPYEVNDTNLYVEGDARKRWGAPQYRSNEARWVRRRLEPSKADNVRINIISPDRWLKLKEAQRVTASPNAASDDWRALGRAYESVIEAKYVIAQRSLKFVPLMLDAYRKAVALDPNSVAARLDTAEALMFCCATMFAPAVNRAIVAEANEAVDHLEAVLALDKTNKDAANGLERLNADISGWSGLPGADKTPELALLIRRLAGLMEKHGLGTKG
jgi:hypothetical protein